MRFRLGFCTATLGMMWGRDKNSIGRYIDDWAPKSGHMGWLLSNLDLCAADLDLTCPDSYLELNLGQTGAVPDGKDFMIEVPHAAPLVEKGVYFDKMHHSAVRTIAWSTPRGLSFKHTPLYLALCTEKALVELWGPRLKKVPAGRPMLSDRGFAGTSRHSPI
jgi:hypothetical protein